MKFLKQLSYDQLMNIPNQPENSCPYINSLQFCGTDKTRVFKIEIDDFDSALIIEGSETVNFFDLIKRLENWSTSACILYKQVMNAYENNRELFSTDFKELLESYEAELSFKSVEEYINNNLVSEINSGISSVNKLGYELQEIIYDYEDRKNEIESLEKEESDISELIDNADEMEDDQLDDLKNKYKSIQSEISVLNKDICHLLSDFDSVTYSYEKEIFKFSEMLEDVRFTNSNARENVANIKAFLITAAKDFLNLHQPYEYLSKVTDSADDNIINIGIISDSPEKNRNIFNFSTNKDFLSKTTIDFVNEAANYSSYKTTIDFKEKYGLEKNEYFSRSNVIKILLNDLKINGFKGLRYYESNEDFINNKDSYKVEVIAKNKLKVSI